MNLRRPFILLLALLFFTHFGFSQKKALTCGNDTLDINMEDQVKIARVFVCAFKFHENKEYPELLKSSVDSFLLNEMDSFPAAKLRLRYWGSFNVYDNDNQKKIAAGCCCDTTERYASFYQIEVEPQFNFTVVFIFDRYGRIINKQTIPIIDVDSDLKLNVDACEAVSLAKSDTVYTGALQSIYLDFADTLGGFVWVIEKDLSSEPGNKKSGLIYIHSQTGDILMREKLLFRAGRKS